MPALITVNDISTAPRYPMMLNLINACSEKAPIEIWNAADIGARHDELGMAGSLTQVIKTFSPKSQRVGELFTGDVPDAVSQLLEKVREAHLLSVKFEV